MNDLKPCPFCGCKEPYIQKVGLSFEPNPIYSIQCADCYCVIGESEGDSSIFWSEKSAADAWNHRSSAWIPVTEKLPKQDQLVLAWSKEFARTSDSGVMCARYDRDTFGDEIMDFHEVSHWQPIEEIPK